ncbi:MAG: alanine racemase [Actinobacteria bacterium]|nr:alanine racemase [Actinomycetota bacterium]
MVRPTRVEVDLEAIRHNVTAFAELISPSAVCAVIKADAYGHGDIPVAEAALGSGATWLAVALVEEGIRLREAGVSAPVLLLSEPGADSVGDILRWELTPTVYTIDFVDALAGSGSHVGVHVKIDTGMHRVGVMPRLVHDLMARIAAASNLTLEAVWTHFAVADEDRVFTIHQIETFQQVVSELGTPQTHLANTAGALLFPEARADMCRIGLGIYGLHPTDETRGLIGLRPAMRVVSQVTHVARLEVGARPSYGRVRALDRDSTVVTVPIGYADGVPRRRLGEVLIGGRRHPFAGRVTMDQIVVEVGDADVGKGDEVVLMGAQGDVEITADEWASEADTISYEIVCGMGPRLPRRYLV